MVRLVSLVLVHPHMWQGSEAEGRVIVWVIFRMIAVFLKVRACFGHETDGGCSGKDKQAEECNLANCPGCKEQNFG